MSLLISGFLVAAAFEPIGLWYLAIPGYAIFFRKLAKTKYLILFSSLFAAITSAIVLHWSSKYVGVLPWLLLTCLKTLFYLPVGWTYKRTQSLRWTILIILLCEEVGARFPFGGFAWTRIAFSQVESPYLKLVSYGGALLLSLVTLLVALALTRFGFKSLVLLLLSIICLGLLPENQVGNEKISLAAIQGNTPTVGLDFNGRAKAVFDLHLNATQEYVTKKYDAIIWPENAIDVDPNNYPEVAYQIDKLINELDTPLVAGVVLNRNGAPENASILYSPKVGDGSIYLKRYLTPFGEYMPLRSLAEIISPYADSVVDFQPGKRFVPHYIKGYPIAPIICYEILNDGIIRQAAMKSTAFIVQTNSATFANTPESAQQLAITRIRAVEHSREILSVSTVGISAFIDNNGQVKSQTAENVSTLLAGDLALQDKNTWADRLGGVAPLLTLLLSFIFALFERRKLAL